MSKWVIGKYIRLSDADRDLMKKEGKTESESVSHQKALIQNFVNEHDELKDCEQYEFFDDGFSGTNFDRPSFEKLIEQIKKGKINCVIVKDFSRFGRDYIELGDYLERIFPFMGVRFISINDHYDSLDYKGTTGGLDVVMKNIVYDYYSKDLSVKVMTAKRAKMKRGLYIGGHVPYGYRRREDDKHRIEIDPEAAEVVREIYDAALDGVRAVDIASQLNDKGYDTPAAYYRRKNPGTKKFANVSELACWNIYSVNKILQNKVYYGVVVGHKREAVAPCSSHTVSVPEDEQIAVENCHPGIVTKEEFLEVQKRFRKQYPQKDERRYDKTRPLVGKAVCGMCGRSMNFRSYVAYGREYSYILCPHAKYQKAGQCCRKYCREADVNEMIWHSIRNLMDMADGAAKKVKKRADKAESENLRTAKKLAKLQKDKEKCESERFSNVDRFMTGKLEKDDYQRIRAELMRRAELLDKQIAEVSAKFHESQAAADDGVRDAVSTMKKYSGETELTREIVEAFIDKILIYDPEHIEIRWKYPDDVVKFIEG